MRDRFGERVCERRAVVWKHVVICKSKKETRRTERDGGGKKLRIFSLDI